MLLLSHSVGVIGGADGPTSILVSSSSGWLSTLLLIAGLVLALYAAVKWLQKKKR